MALNELIDDHVSLQQCKLAVDTLHAHSTKKAEQEAETELLPGKEQYIWLNVSVKRMAPGHKFKPVKIPVVHPLVDPRTTPICLLTKDPQREYKDLLETNDVKFVTRVIGIEKLKGKFRPFEARRMLLKEIGMFLADERILPLLPKLLGAKWFDAKKQPIPVNLTRKDIKGELERAITSTYMNQNRGTFTSVKIASLTHTPTQILNNIKRALPSVAKHIYGGWDNIQSISIKTNSSVSLPVWSCSLSATEGGRWDGLTAVPDVEMASEDEGVDEAEASEDEMVVDAAPAKSKAKGKAVDAEVVPKKKGKRAAGADDADEGEKEEKPKKKLKKAAETTSVVSDPSVDAPTQSKKRKAKESLPTPAAKPSVAAAPAPDDSAKPKKRRKSDIDAIVPSAPEPTPKSSQKKPRPSVPSTATESQPTPSKSSKKPFPDAATTPVVAKTPKAAATPTESTHTVSTSAKKSLKKKKGGDLSQEGEVAIEKETKTSSIVETVSEVAVSASKEDSETPSKKKKAKKDAAPIAVAPSDDPAPDVAEAAVSKDDSETPSKKKKKAKKDTAAAVAPSDAPASDVAEAAVSKDDSETPSKKKKKGKKDVVAAPGSSDVAPAEVAGASAEMAVDPEAPKNSTPKAKKSKAQTDAADGKKASLSKDDLTLKRASMKTGAGEKKKEKVVKARGGKSVKDGVIGKKVAQG